MAMPVWIGESTAQDVIEAVVRHGVRQFPLDRYLAMYPNERVDWFRLHAKAGERWKAVRYCRSRIGDQYASARQFARSFGWLGPVIRRLLGLPADVDADRQFCSELVSAALKAAGLPIPLEPALMTPRDCAELPYVAFQTSIVAG